ncbi:acyl carrier protein [Streptomyces niger]|uniref:acyl carrier protein n=1 Tax=Streptomyces niger TaxID=66373 RepID=UPI00069C2C7C|nr:acyl carrier protein [Streptomyces niger]
MFADDADLEAELGVDSLKQMELMSALANKYGLPQLPTGFRISEYSTIPDVADLVRKLAGGEAPQGRRA